ncbi:MAG: hypothetical protein NXI10_12250 [bacterium]|nr:hypothetical protein [bacterium]
MRKSSLLLVNGLLSLFILMGSCSGKEQTKDETTKSSETLEIEEEEVDTVWLEPEVTNYVSWNWSLDTSFLRNGERIHYSMSLRNLRQSFAHVASWEKDDTTFAQQLKGPQFEISMVARTDRDQILTSTLLHKEHFVGEDNAHFITADSYTQFRFMGYHPEFKAILLEAFMGYPSTDFGVLMYYFIGLDGKIKKQVNEGTPSEICDTEPVPSPDGKSFSFCSGILHSDYSMTSVEREQPLAGIFQLGNKNSIAVYMFEGKPPYSNMKVLGSNGSVQKSFPFEGLMQEMTYTALHCRLKNGNLVMFDDAQRQLFVFNPKTPTQPKVIRFDALPEPTERAQTEGEEYRLRSFKGEFLLYHLDGTFYLEEELTSY